MRFNLMPNRAHPYFDQLAVLTSKPAHRSGVRRINWPRSVGPISGFGYREHGFNRR
jgi:hypothetical protein